MFWDFFTLVPESTLNLMYRFSDRGLPCSYVNMDGFGIHTFKLKKC